MILVFLSVLALPLDSGHFRNVVNVRNADPAERITAR